MVGWRIMNNINELRAAEERAYREHLNALTTAADTCDATLAALHKARRRP